MAAPATNTKAPMTWRELTMRLNSFNPSDAIQASVIGGGGRREVGAGLNCGGFNGGSRRGARGLDLGEGGVGFGQGGWIWAGGLLTSGEAYLSW